MIQLEQQQRGEFVVLGGVADTNYLYPARWGWIKNNYLIQLINQALHSTAL